MNITLALLAVILVLGGCMDASLSQSGSAPARINLQQVPNSVTDLNLSVSGPGMSDINTTLTRTTDAVVLEVPVGPNRVFELEAGVYSARAVKGVVPGGVQVDLQLLTDFLVFTARWDGDREIYRIPVGAPELMVKLSDNLSFESRPTFSPDGTRILFESNRTGAAQLYVMDFDGGNVSLLSSGAAELYPGSERLWSVSPDGSTVAYFSPDGQGNLVIYTVPISAASPPSQLLAGATSTSLVEPLQWSPDGSALLYVDRSQSTDNVDTVDVGTGTVTTLASPAFTGFADWVPDGNRVVYLYEASGTYYLETVTTNPQIPDPIILDSFGDFLFVVGNSPDRKTVAYARPQTVGSSTDDLYVVNADGSASPTRVFTDTDTYTGSLAYSPDGSLIAITRSFGDLLAVVRADGSGVVETIGGIASSNDYEPRAWAPDSSAFAYVESEFVGESTNDALLLSDLDGDPEDDRILVERRDIPSSINDVDWGP